ncbi:MAG TPA: hypothetical protein VKV17_12200 [Bryobacteraceae bacterium]|nr:hypothetical protein [Bryobacteraceae bacterium]
MAEPGPPPAPETASPAPGPPRSVDEVALELMKFIAVTTGYGRSSQPAAGFSGKPVNRSPEEHAEALLELFERCRRTVKKQS